MLSPGMCWLRADLKACCPFSSFQQQLLFPVVRMLKRYIGEMPVKRYHMLKTEESWNEVFGHMGCFEAAWEE